MKITIRQAVDQDIDTILSITSEAFSKYAFDLGKKNIKALQEKRETLEYDLQKKCVLVGELDQQVVGSVRCEFLPTGIAYFSRFGVRLHAQSCGMGSQLVNAVISLSHDQNMRAIALHTSSKMFSLVRFYYGKGFFIHSTSSLRGYPRALLIKELINTSETCFDYRPQIPNDY